MKKITLTFIAALFVVIFIAKPAYANNDKILMAGTSAVLKDEFFINKKDCRIEKLRNFLESYNSPFSNKAT